MSNLSKLAREIAIKHALPGRYDGLSFHATRRGDADDKPYIGAIREALTIAFTPSSTLDEAAIVEAVAAECERCARLATSFLVGDPRNGVPLRNPMPHEIAAAIRRECPTTVGEPIPDDCLRAMVGELGNQIHNLGCENQNDERLSNRLGALSSMAWDIAKKASATPTPNAAADALAEACTEIPHGRWLTDADYRSKVERWWNTILQPALATYRQQQPGKSPLNDEGKA